MNLFHRKDWNKVYPGIHFNENAEILTAGDMFYWKFSNAVRFGIYFIEKGEVRHGWGFISYKMIQ